MKVTHCFSKKLLSMLLTVFVVAGGFPISSFIGKATGIEGNFTDSFDRADNTNPGSNWISNNSAGSIVGNKLKITLPSNSWEPFFNQAVLLNGADDATQYISVDITNQLGYPNYAGIWARYNNSTKSGYSLWFLHGHIFMRKYVNDESKTLDFVEGASIVNFTPNASHQYRLYLGVSNNASGAAVINGSVLDLTTGYLVAKITKTDNMNPIESGTTGLFCYGETNPTGAFFDNFYYSSTKSNFTDGEFTDSFDRADSTQPGSNWISNNSAGSIVGNKLKITLPSNSWEPFFNQAVLLNGANDATQHISVDVTNQLDYPNYAGIWARYNNSTKSGYSLWFLHGHIFVRKYVNDESKTLDFVEGASMVNFNPVAGHRYRLYLSVSDNTNYYAVIKGSVLDLTTGNLVAEVTKTDNTNPIARGTAGVFCYGETNPTGAFFDDFYYSPTKSNSTDEEFTDSFDRADNTNPGSNWISNNNAGSIVGNKLKITLPSNSWEPFFNQAVLLNGADDATQHISVDVTNQLGYPNYAGIWARYNNSTKSGYSLWFLNGYIFVRKYVNNENKPFDFAEGTSTVNFNPVAGHQYRLYLDVSNNASGTAVINGSVLDLTTGFLIAKITKTDNTNPIARGTAGVFCYGETNPTGAFFDNFYYSSTKSDRTDEEFTDSFDRTDSSNPGPNWISNNNAGSIVGNKLKITLPSNSWEPFFNQAVLLNEKNDATQYISVDVTNQLGYPNYAGIWARYNNSTKSGYSLWFLHGHIFVRKYVNDVNKTLDFAEGASIVNFTPNSSHRYRLYLSVSDNTNYYAVIKGSVLDLTTGNLIAEVTKTDTMNPIARGTAGVFCYGETNPTGAFFDDFYYSSTKSNSTDEEFTDSFDRADNTQPGSNWISNNSAGSIVGNKLKITLPINSWEPFFNQAVLLNGADDAIQYISVDVTNQLGYPNYAGIWARYNNSTKSGYSLWFLNGYIFVRKYVNDENKTLDFAEGASTVKFTPNASHQYRLYLSIFDNTSGAAIKASVLDLTTGFLVANVTKTDTTNPIARGTAGLFCYGETNPTGAFFDNFYYSSTKSDRTDEEFTDSYDRTDSTNPGPNWISNNSGGSIFGNKLKITLPSNSWEPFFNQAVLLNEKNDATQNISVDVTNQLDYPNYAGIWARYNNSSKSGYSLWFLHGHIFVRKYVNDENKTLDFAEGASIVNFTPNSSHRYRLYLSVSDNENGDAVVKGSVLDFTTGNWVAEVTKTDTTNPIERGTAGLFCYGETNPTGAFFDEFYYSTTKPLKGGADVEANALRAAIHDSTASLTITGQKYYLSNQGNDSNDGKSPAAAWRTLDALSAHSSQLTSGDGVLFERGSIFRQNSSLILRSGISYGAYGTGNKPAIYGSSKNYSEAGLWTPSTKGNVWVLEMPSSNFVGNIVFNHGVAVGILQTGFSKLTKNLDYYFSSQDHLVYLYLDKGAPNIIYDDIEICVNSSIIKGPIGVSNVKIDNICMKYTAAFGMDFQGSTSNVTITNCELGWIGGTYYGGDTSDVRLGNGIQLWNNSQNVKISNNWIYQVYDAGISPQGEAGMVADHIEISSNLIEFCTFSYEHFIMNNTGYLSNIQIKDNIMRFAGYGWGQQRPDPDYNSHFCGWDYNLSGCLANFTVQNNIFDLSSNALVAWHWETGNPVQQGLTVSGNTYYQRANGSSLAMWFGYGTSYLSQQKTAANQAELEAAVSAFDNNPNLVKWLNE